jgi:hypothetical protein
MNDEFYIGWEDSAPPGLRIWLRRSVAALAIVALVVIGWLALNQRRLEDGVFEFGVRREFTGVIYELPIPMLRIIGTDGTATNHVLVGAGKFGLPAFARNHDGHKVTFMGTTIRKDAAVMIELNDADSFAVLGDPLPHERRGEVESLGDAELTGELVDTKCYFGVMRPATGKVHRACAVRCLSGGVPPGMLIRDALGNGVVVMLAAADGGALPFDVQWAARSIRARGNLEIRNGVPILRASDLQLAD